MSSCTEKYGRFVYNTNSKADFLDKTADLVVQLLIRKKATISIAESCTGGMLSQYITSVSGASDIFELGICSYSNRIKISELGIDESVINKYTEISAECAVAMSQGIIKKSGAKIGVGITGIAGPLPVGNNPVGTVFVAVCDKNTVLVENLKLHELYDSLTRQKVRELSTGYALKMIEDILR